MLYCTVAGYIFTQFDYDWMKAKHKDIMEFSQIKAELIQSLNKKLEDPKAVLKWTAPVDYK